MSRSSLYTAQQKILEGPLRRRIKYARKLSDWRQHADFYELHTLLQDPSGEVRLEAARSLAQSVQDLTLRYMDCHKSSMANWWMGSGEEVGAYPWYKALQEGDKTIQRRRDVYIPLLEDMLLEADVAFATAIVTTLYWFSSKDSMSLILSRARSLRSSSLDQIVSLYCSVHGGEEAIAFIEHQLDDIQTGTYGLFSLAWMTRVGAERCDLAFALLKTRCHSKNPQLSALAKALCLFLEGADKAPASVLSVMSEYALTRENVQGYLQRGAVKAKQPTRRHKRRGKGKARRAAFQQARHRAREHTSTLTLHTQQAYHEGPLYDEEYDVWDDPYMSRYHYEAGYLMGRSGLSAHQNRWFETHYGLWLVSRCCELPLSEHLKELEHPESTHQMAALIALVIRGEQERLTDDILAPFFTSCCIEQIEAGLVVLPGLDERRMLSWVQYAQAHTGVYLHRVIIRVLALCESEAALLHLLSMLPLVNEDERWILCSALRTFGPLLEQHLPTLISFRESLILPDEPYTWEETFWCVYAGLLSDMGTPEAIEELRTLDAAAEGTVSHIREAIGLAGGWSEADVLQEIAEEHVLEDGLAYGRQYPDIFHIVAVTGEPYSLFGLSVSVLFGNVTEALSYVLEQLSLRERSFRERGRGWEWSMGWCLGESSLAHSLFQYDQPESLYGYDFWTHSMARFRRSVSTMLEWSLVVDADETNECAEEASRLRLLLHCRCNTHVETLQKILQRSELLMWWEKRCFESAFSMYRGWLLQIEGETLEQWQSDLECLLF